MDFPRNERIDVQSAHLMAQQIAALKRENAELHAEIDHLRLVLRDRDQEPRIRAVK
jgi:cell division protein FtsB